MPEPTCRPVDVDGTPVLVRSGKPLTGDEQAALADVVRAVRTELDRPERAAAEADLAFVAAVVERTRLTAPLNRLRQSAGTVLMLLDRLEEINHA